MAEGLFEMLQEHGVELVVGAAGGVGEAAFVQQPVEGLRDVPAPVIHPQLSSKINQLLNQPRGRP